MKGILILIRGPICAGKTTVVQGLSDILVDCSVVDQDFLKRGIDKIKPSLWRDKIAFDTTLFLVEQLMKKRRLIVADIHSAVRRQYVEYRKLARKYDYPLFSFLLYPPLEVCIERNQKRVIPDVRYEVSDQDIRRYWEKVFSVIDELIFDTSTMSVEEVKNVIIEIIRKGDLI